MFKSRFTQILIGAGLLVGIILIVNAAGPNVGAVSNADPTGFGALRQLEGSQTDALTGASPTSQQALSAWAARYQGQANALANGSPLSQQALSAWAARYQGQASALANGSPLSQQALSAWAARYQGQASALANGSPLSQKALSAWAARYQGQANAFQMAVHYSGR